MEESKFASVSEAVQKLLHTVPGSCTSEISEKIDSCLNHISSPDIRQNATQYIVALAILAEAKGEMIR